MPFDEHNSGNKDPYLSCLDMAMSMCELSSVNIFGSKTDWAFCRPVRVRVLTESPDHSVVCILRRVSTAEPLADSCDPFYVVSSKYWHATLWFTSSMRSSRFQSDWTHLAMHP